jgi:molecular chaperone DnaK
LIDANTTIPTKKSETFSTAADNQPSVEVHIYQGERPMVSGNRSLGKFYLEGIPPAPRGVPQIEVTLDVDANGILNVSAKDKATGKSKNIRIEGSSGIPKDEIEKMKREAKANEAEDKKIRELADKVNAAEGLIFQIEKELNESGDKISAELKKEAEDGIVALRTACTSKDANGIDASVLKLNNVTQRMYEEKMKGQAPQNTPPPTVQPDGQKTEDVPYEEVQK